MKRHGTKVLKCILFVIARTLTELLLLFFSIMKLGIVKLGIASLDSYVKSKEI